MVPVEPQFLSKYWILAVMDSENKVGYGVHDILSGCFVHLAISQLQ